MIAAVGAGWFDSIEQAAETMSATGERFQANPEAHENWQSLLSRQQRFNDFCCHNPLTG
jgi:ribulose kinase